MDRGATRHAGDLPVLVLHGWGAHLEAVEPILLALEGETRVLALDMPGFGQSDPPPEAWDADDYTRFVLRYLDELGVERVHLLGHSFGGRVAICMAAEHPGRVGRLLLCDSAGLRPKRGMKYRAKVGVAKAGKVAGRLGASGVQDRLRARVASSDYLNASEAMRGTFRRVIEQDLSDRLPRIGATTLLVWGDQDDDTPLWMAHRMEELIPDAGLAVFEGAGHYSYADDPGRFGSVARLFLCEQPRELAGAA
ncbi:MAG: alpha/beta hydrolase [Actinomycetota bacterium]|nr:alpha/beta hydrolase [Actinomycetota bacterium]